MTDPKRQPQISETVERRASDPPPDPRARASLRETFRNPPRFSDKQKKEFRPLANITIISYSPHCLSFFHWSRKLGGGGGGGAAYGSYASAAGGAAASAASAASAGAAGGGAA